MYQVVAVVLMPVLLLLGQEPLVQLSAIWVDTVKRGNIVRMARGLGVLTATRKAEITIPELPAREIGLGQTAVVDTRHGVVRGRVVRIYPMVDEQVRVELDLDGDAPGGATPGTEIDGMIHVSTLKDVVYVARPYGAQSESTLGIFRLEADGLHAVRRQVEFGFTAFSTAEKGGVQQPAEPVIEIRSGLQPGDKVILSDMSAYKDANQVRLQF